ncbi:MAG: response regulator [Oceanidesulfovibrio sp.]
MSTTPPPTAGANPVPISDLVEPAYAVSPDTIIRDIKPALEGDDPVSCLVVVKDKRPLGLVMSIHLDRALSQQYGVALFYKKPIAQIMDTAPLVVSLAAPVESAASQAMSRPARNIYDHLIVVDEAGLYQGIVSVQEMLITLSSMQQRRTLQMMEVMDKLRSEVVERKRAQQDLLKSKKTTEYMNRKLRLAYERLQEVDKMKTDFLSTVSHELRTPLTSVLGFAEMVHQKLRDTIIPLLPEDNAKAMRAAKSVDRNVGIIHMESQRLTELINDVLDIAKMEAGRIEWKSEPMDVASIVRQAADATNSLFAKSGLPLEIDVEDEIPSLIGDPHRLMQVVINLLSNAVKFTKQGRITCRAYLEGERVRVDVTDTGVGIAPDDLDKVFEKFKQVGDTLTDKPTGTGLGLSICKQIVERHGGEIWVESIPGLGSTFSFTVPTAPPRERKRSLNLAPLLQRIKAHSELSETAGTQVRPTVLVVDDDDSIREYLSQLLTDQGYDVDTAVDGMDALKRVSAKPPDIIVLDIMMPNMDGMETARRLKENPETASLPIIILTIEGDPEEGFRLGVDRFFTKPLVRKEFLSDLATLTRKDGSRTVLIVETTPARAGALSEVIGQHGYNVEEAYSADEALEKAELLRPGVVVANAELARSSDLPRRIRYDLGMETAYIVLVGEKKRHKEPAAT